MKRGVEMPKCDFNYGKKYKESNGRVKEEFGWKVIQCKAIQREERPDFFYPAEKEREKEQKRERERGREKSQKRFRRERERERERSCGWYSMDSNWQG